MPHILVDGDEDETVEGRFVGGWRPDVSICNYGLATF